MLKILLAVSIFCFAGCRLLEDAPITRLFVIDTKHGVCSVREITDKKTLASVRVKTVPIDECDGIWGLSAKEFLDMRSYLQNEQEQKELNALKGEFKNE